MLPGIFDYITYYITSPLFKRWQGLIDRARSIDASYDCLLRILSEPHRDRLMLITSIDRKLNYDVLTFMDPFGKLFRYINIFSIASVPLVHEVDL